MKYGIFERDYKHVSRIIISKESSDISSFLSDEEVINAFKRCCNVYELFVNGKCICNSVAYALNDLNEIFKENVTVCDGDSQDGGFCGVFYIIQGEDNIKIEERNILFESNLRIEKLQYNKASLHISEYYRAQKRHCIKSMANSLRIVRNFYPEFNPIK